MTHPPGWQVGDVSARFLPPGWQVDDGRTDQPQLPLTRRQIESLGSAFDQNYSFRNRLGIVNALRADPGIAAAEPSRLALGPNTVLPTGEALRDPVQRGVLNRQVTENIRRTSQQADALGALRNFASPEARRLLLHEPATQRRAAVRREQIAPGVPQRRRDVAEVQSMFAREQPGSNIEFSPEIAAIGDSRRSRLIGDEGQYWTPEQRIFYETTRGELPTIGRGLMDVFVNGIGQILTSPLVDIPGLPEILEPSLADFLFIGLGTKAILEARSLGRAATGIFAPVRGNRISTLFAEDTGARLAALGMGELASELGAGPIETVLLQLGAGWFGAIKGGTFAAGVSGTGLLEAGEAAMRAGKTLTEETMLAMGRAVENFNPRLQPFAHVEGAARTQARWLEGGRGKADPERREAIQALREMIRVGDEAISDPTKLRELTEKGVLRSTLGPVFKNQSILDIFQRHIKEVVDELKEVSNRGLPDSPQRRRGEAALAVERLAPFNIRDELAQPGGAEAPGFELATSIDEYKAMEVAKLKVKEQAEPWLSARSPHHRQNYVEMGDFNAHWDMYGNVGYGPYTFTEAGRRTLAEIESPPRDLSGRVTAGRFAPDPDRRRRNAEGDARQAAELKAYDLVLTEVSELMDAMPQRVLQKLNAIAHIGRFGDPASDARPRNLDELESLYRAALRTKNTVFADQLATRMRENPLMNRYLHDWRDEARDIIDADSSIRSRMSNVEQSDSRLDVGDLEDADLEQIEWAKDALRRVRIINKILDEHTRPIGGPTPRRIAPGSRSSDWPDPRVTAYRRTPDFGGSSKIGTTKEQQATDSLLGKLNLAINTKRVKRELNDTEVAVLRRLMDAAGYTTTTYNHIFGILSVKNVATDISDDMLGRLRQLNTDITMQRTVHPFDAVTTKIQQALTTKRGIGALNDGETTALYSAMDVAKLSDKEQTDIFRVLVNSEENISPRMRGNLRRLSKSMAENQPSRPRLDPNAPSPTIHAEVSTAGTRDPEADKLLQGEPDAGQLPLGSEQQGLFGTGGVDARPKPPEEPISVAPIKYTPPLSSKRGGPQTAALIELNRIHKTSEGVLEANIPKIARRKAEKLQRGHDVPTEPLDLGNGIPYQTLHTTAESQRGLSLHQIVRNDAWARGATPAYTRAQIDEKVARIRVLMQFSADEVLPHNVPGEVAAEMNAILRSLQGVDTRGRIGRTSRQLASILLDIPGAMQTMWTMLDLSSILRQGVILLSDTVLSTSGKRRRQGYDAVSAAVHAFFRDPDRAAKLNEVEYQRGIDNGFIEANGTITRTGPDAKLYEREQVFAENIIDRLPILGPAKRRSEVSFSLFLNKLRNDAFEYYTDGWLEVNPGAKNVPGDTKRAMTEFINAASGVGDLGPFQSDVTQRALFFALGFQVSRVQAFKRGLRSSDPFVRKRAAFALVKFFGMGSLTLALLKFSGAADVELDPRSSDFGQIRVGNSRVDMWAGFRPWAVFIGRTIALGLTKAGVLEGNIKTLGTGRPRTSPFFGLAENFITNKLGPLPGIGLQLKEGKDIAGRPYGLRQAIAQAGVPLIIQNVVEAIEVNGLGGIWTTVPEFFGAGTSTFEPTGAVIQTTTRELTAAGTLTDAHFNNQDVSNRDASNLNQAGRAEVEADPQVRAKRDERVQDEGAYFFMENTKRRGENDILEAINAGANPLTVANAVRDYLSRNFNASKDLFNDDERPDPQELFDSFRDRWWGADAPIDPFTGEVDFYAQQLERDRTLEDAEKAGLTDDQIDLLQERLPNRFETEDPRVIAAVELYQDTVTDLASSGLLDQDRLTWHSVVALESIDIEKFPSFTAWREDQVATMISVLGVIDREARKLVAKLKPSILHRDILSLRRSAWVLKTLTEGNVDLLENASNAGLLNIPAEYMHIFNMARRNRSTQ